MGFTTRLTCFFKCAPHRREKHFDIMVDIFQFKATTLASGTAEKSPDSWATSSSNYASRLFQLLAEVSYLTQECILPV